jgi:hypothetical protein
MIVFSVVVYEYEDIFLFLINVILLINIKFVVKYYFNRLTVT